MIFNYPYTDLYNLNLDWVLKAIKEVQEVIGQLGTVVNSVNGQSGDVVLTDELITSILGSVVNSINGQAGAVVLTKEMLSDILQGVVNSFNGRSGDVVLLPADVNATRIDITWTSDPGETIGSLSQSEINTLYADGKRILIFVNNLGSPDQIYFLTLVGDVVTPQPYTPTASTSGVLSVNGQSGVVTLNGDNIPIALGETESIGEALEGKQATLTFDSAPTLNSNNPVTSGGVYAADQQLGNAITTLAGTVNTQSDQIGNVALPTTAQTLTGAIAENSSDITALENATADSGWQEITLTQFATGYVRYRKKCGIVTVIVPNYNFTGLTANADNVIATLPLGYRPRNPCIIANYNGIGYLIIDTGGGVCVHPTSTSFWASGTFTYIEA